MDIASGDRDLEDIGAEALPAALVARDVHIGHEDHLDFEIAGALTLLAASTGNVEAERPRRIAALT
ncbi:MAG TPA: hypothetical protein VKH19_00860 [Gemmatimonadaceae bacterium]|nr:hypothetical protein [Gemmatimonadaceae bacterium]